jgi:N-acetylglutamate synthase-like GNAT family acetyltransferase
MAQRSAHWVRFDWPLAAARFEVSIAPGYRLREASAGDLQAMLTLVATAYGSDPSWKGVTDEIESRVGGRIRERLLDLAAHFVLALHGEDIVGLNGVALQSPTKMNLITGICVAPAHQGRGLGAALLGRSLEWLRDQDLPVATVTTDADAVAAKVYARFGAIRFDDVDFPDPFQ